MNKKQIEEMHKNLGKPEPGSDKERYSVYDMYEDIEDYAEAERKKGVERIPPNLEELHKG